MPRGSPPCVSTSSIRTPRSCRCVEGRIEAGLVDSSTLPNPSHRTTTRAEDGFVRVELADTDQSGQRWDSKVNQAIEG